MADYNMQKDAGKACGMPRSADETGASMADD